VNFSTKQARTATSSGTCKLEQSERITKGKQCAFGSGEVLDKYDPGYTDSLDGVEKFTSVRNGVGQVGVDSASAGTRAGPASDVATLAVVFGAWMALGLLSAGM